MSPSDTSTGDRIPSLEGLAANYFGPHPAAHRLRRLGVAEHVADDCGGEHASLSFLLRDG